MDETGRNLLLNNGEPGTSMSPEEFQNKLFVLCEERGVLSELRSHLRHQMIEALKTTEIGRQVSSAQKLNQNLSPKYQALNLLIAEYLMKQRYHYALSVFSSEVPMLSSYPEFTKVSPTNADVSQSGDDGSSSSKFKDRDVWDILEAMGLPAESKQAKEIHSAYFNNYPKEALLVCMIRLLPASLRKIVSHNKKKPHKTSILSVSISTDSSSDIQTDDIAIVNSPKVTKKKHVKENKGEVDENTQGLGSKENLENEASQQPASNVNAVDLENIMLELHERMQRVFDHELEVAQHAEWQKCRNMMEERENEIIEELGEERNQIHLLEMQLKDKMQVELEKHKSVLAEQYRRKERVLERDSEKKLEMEKSKLLEEYRQVFKTKSEDVPSIITEQQNYLSRALEAVQNQFDKLREKEELLDKRLSEIDANIEIKSREVVTKVKETSDAASQSFEMQNEDLSLSKEREAIQKLKHEFEEAIKNIKTVKKSVMNDLNSTFINKEVQTCRKVMANKGMNTEVNDEKIITSHSKEFTSRGIGNSPRDYPSFADGLNKKDGLTQTDFDQISCQDQMNNNDSMESGEDSLGYVLKELHSENTYLKAFTSQQRLQIKDLISKQAMMGKEVSEAHCQVQELSVQLAELGKVVHSNTILRRSPSKTRIKSAPSTSRNNEEKPISKLRNFLNETQDSDRNSPTHSLESNHLKETIPQSRSKISIKPSIEKQNALHQSERFITGGFQFQSSTSEYSEDDLKRRRSTDHKYYKKEKIKSKKIDGNLSPTDEILKEAKLRLKMLELESEAVDRSYQEFKQRQSETLIESINSKLMSEGSSSILAERMSHSCSKFADSFPSAQLRRQFASKDKLTETFNVATESHLANQIPCIRENESPRYNIMRRVHEPSMNIDKNVLQNYISSAQRMSQYTQNNPKSFANILLKNNLERQYKSASNTPMKSKKLPGTSFLMERIENSLKPERPRYDFSKIGHKFIKKSQAVSSNHPVFVNIKQNGKSNMGSVNESKHKGLTVSKEQFEIKPRRSWMKFRVDKQISSNVGNDSSREIDNVSVQRNTRGSDIENQSILILNRANSFNLNESKIVSEALDKDRRFEEVQYSISSPDSTSKIGESIKRQLFPESDVVKNVIVTSEQEIEKKEELVEAFEKLQDKETVSLIKDIEEQDVSTEPNICSPEHITNYAIEGKAGELEVVGLVDDDVDLVKDSLNTNRENVVEDEVVEAENYASDFDLGASTATEQKSSFEIRSDSDSEKAPIRVEKNAPMNIVRSNDIEEATDVNILKELESIILEDVKDDVIQKSPQIEVNDMTVEGNENTAVEHLGVKNDDLVLDMGPADEIMIHSSTVENTTNEDVAEKSGSTKDVQNDTALSEELVVPSSFEMSDQSAVSVPHASDENDNFWE